MAEKKQFRAIKGTRDILPPDSALWNWFEQAARDTFERYGYRDIRTPIFEETELFARSVGGDTDIIGKEMYSFTDGLAHLNWIRNHILSQDPAHDDAEAVGLLRAEIDFLVRHVVSAIQQGEMPNSAENQDIFQQVRLEQETVDSPIVAVGMGIAKFKASLLNIRRLLPKFRFGETLALRPEATASVVRAYIEHGMNTLPGDVKLYYMGPMFRRERPQKGRYRQFYQIGAEVLGQSDAPAIDAELIEMLVVFFRRVGLDRDDAVHQFDRRQELPAAICRTAARGIAQSERQPRR